MTKIIALVFVLSAWNLRAQDTQPTADTLPPSKSKIGVTKNTPAKEDDSANEAADQNTKTAPVVANAGPGYLTQALGIGLGQTILLSDYADHGDDKLAMDLLYQYRASYSFSFLADFHSSTYKKDDGQKTKMTSLALDIKGKLYDYDAFAPYIVGGLGLYWPRVTRYIGNNSLESDNRLTLGVNLGLGADLQLNDNFSFGFVGHYHHPFSVKQDNQESVSGSYMRIMATVFIHF